MLFVVSEREANSKLGGRELAANGEPSRAEPRERTLRGGGVGEKFGDDDKDGGGGGGGCAGEGRRGGKTRRERTTAAERRAHKHTCKLQGAASRTIPSSANES